MGTVNRSERYEPDDGQWPFGQVRAYKVVNKDQGILYQAEVVLTDDGRLVFFNESWTPITTRPSHPTQSRMPRST